MSDGQRKMSFLDHLEELRMRLIRCAIAIVAGMVVCWIFREDLLAFLEAPLFDAWSKVDGLPPPQPLNFSGMLEPFIAYLKLSVMGGFFLASPVILYNLWRFVSPGLYPRERKVALPFVLVSTLLFVGGSLTAYYIVFPIGFRFFLDFAAGAEVDTVRATVEVSSAGADPPSSRSHALRPHSADRGPPSPESDYEEESEPETIDAGPDPESDARVDAGPHAYQAEADLSARGDAGAPPDAGMIVSDVSENDAGLRVDAGPPAEASEAEPIGPVAEPEKEPSWYEWLLVKLFKSGCRDLESVAVFPQVRLRFVWHERKCGAFPDIIRVDRNGERLMDIEPSEPVPLEGGSSYREMIDAPGPGTHSYEVGFSSARAGRSKLAPVLMVKDFLSFAMRLILAFGIIFELPVLISFLSIAGIVNYRQLLRFSRWFFVVAVILGAVLTPPDIITQVLLAIPMMLLYFLSVLVAWLFGPKPEDP